MLKNTVKILLKYISKILRIGLIIFIILNIILSIEFIRQEIAMITVQLDTVIHYQSKMHHEIAKSINRDADLMKYIEERFDTEELKREIEKLTPKLIEYKLQLINVGMYNKTIGTQGSGIILKYDNSFYILGVAHLVNKGDEIYLIENNKIIDKLDIIKVDNEKDLALLKLNNPDIIPEFWTELGKEEPIKSEEVYIIGNPAGIEDLLSIGRVVAYTENYFYFYNKVFFGSSGGGVFNKEGNLIGIISHIKVKYVTEKAPPFVVHGAVRLNQIKLFLGE